MSRPLLFFVIIFMFLSSAVFSQEAEPDMFEFEEDGEETENKKPREDLWFGFGGDTALYSMSGFTYGASFSFGYGSGASIGIKASYFFSDEDVEAFELNFFVRFYFLRMANRGPFLQIMGGPVFFNRSGDFSIPPEAGMITGGLSFGWRFVLADRIYLEPSVRGGYPYLFGASVALGARF